jgi:hypothetical protein
MAGGVVLRVGLGTPPRIGDHAGEAGSRRMRRLPATTGPGARVPITFDKPVVILSAPRSGSTLLFETLARAPGLQTIGGESHRVIEGVPALHPAMRGYASNRLEASDAAPGVIDALHQRFAAALRDRDGVPMQADGHARLLEKTPKNVLRIPFLREVFPDARFVVLWRDPPAVLSSMMEAWRSGHFVTYPGLPGWSGPPWSLLLVPGWQRIAGRALEEIVAYQWGRAMHVMLDDLDALPRDAWRSVRYESLVAGPRGVVDALCTWLDLEWDAPLEALPLSRYTLSKPEAGKWRRNQAAIERVLPLVSGVADRLERVLAGRIAS